MAFASALIRRLGTIGKFRINFGTFTSSAGGTGGNVDTKLRLCFFFIPWAKTAAADVYVNADFSAGPLDGSAIAIVSAANATGYWLAIGV